MNKLSDEQLRELAQRHFGDLGPQAVAIAYAVAMAESGGDADAMFDNYPRFQPADSIYRYDRGLWQINSVHCLPVSEGGLGFDSASLFDPEYNAQCARRVLNLQGWTAWTTFKGGHYLAFYTEPEAVAPGAAEPPRTPPMLAADRVYALLADAFVPAYDPARTSIFEPVRYQQEGDRTYAVYELRVEVLPGE